MAIKTLSGWLASQERSILHGQIRDQTKIENIGFQTSYDSAVYVGVWTPKRGIKMATNV